jgi:hypothetical protein
VKWSDHACWFNIALERAGGLDVAGCGIDAA